MMNRAFPGTALAIGVVLASAAAQTACSPGAGNHSAQTGAVGNDAQPSVSDFQVGARLGTHGGIAQGAETTRFKLGDTIHIAMRVRGANGTLVKVVWKAPGGEMLGEDSSSLRPGQEYVHFSADSENLLAGAGYQAEVSANGKPVTVLRFDLI